MGLVEQGFSVAARGVEARTLKLSLPGQTVSPDPSTLRIRLAAPEHFHLNSLAPSELKLTSSNAPVLELGKETISWTTDDPFVELLVSLSVNDGDAIPDRSGAVPCRQSLICLMWPMRR